MGRVERKREPLTETCLGTSTTARDIPCSVRRGSSNWNNPTFHGLSSVFLLSHSVLGGRLDLSCSCEELSETMQNLQQQSWSSARRGSNFSSTTAREQRMQRERRSILRRNRADPELERAARTGTRELPLKYSHFI